MNDILMGNDARCPCECENICVLNSDLDLAEHRIKQLEAALKRIRDCDWIHCLALRTKEDTQLEHREIAEAISEIFAKEFPVIAESLKATNTH